MPSTFLEKRKRMDRKKRFLIGAVIIAAALAYLIYGGMQEAIVYFKTPTELKGQEKALRDRSLRLGGMVVAGSLQKDLQTLTYRFQLTDGVASIPVFFRGVPPDLFSEGKGAVVEGRIGDDGVFLASTIMAKHAEEYSPPHPEKSSYPQSFVPAQDEKKP
jgi:cytochrome c-type biogenesis protein CcmE